MRKVNLKLNLYTLCHQNLDIFISKKLVYNEFGNVESTNSFSIFEKDKERFYFVISPNEA